MFKKISIIIGILVFALVIFVVAARLLTDEDTWLCQDGQWIKHGQPSAAMPTQPCGEVKVVDFETCAQANNLIMESYPRQCRDQNGNSFTEDIGNELEKTD